jgi:ATP-dependent DNA ligase
MEATILKLFGELGRPVHLGDLKRALGIRSKRDSAKRSHTESDGLSRQLHRLFVRGRVSKSKETARVEGYPASPYSRVRKEVTTNVKFYAPPEYAGRRISFTLNGTGYSLDFIDYKAYKALDKEPTKKELVREILMKGERALTANEVLERLNEEHNLYDVSTKQRFYNATTSLTKAVLRKLMREGLRARMYDGRWVWYYTEEQLDNYRQYYVENDEVLRAVRDLVKGERCVPLTKVVSHLQVSPDDVRYRVKRSGKWVPVKVRVETQRGEMRVHLEVGGFKRDSLVDWLGVVAPRSEGGYGYETMLVDLDSDWEEALKEQIKKSLSRMNIRTIIGHFYEKLVAKLFELLCTSPEMQRHPELSKYMIPFVFRSGRVANVWTTMPSGRRAEFDVLIRGTFRAFDAIAQGRSYLDLVIPVESKYTVVTTEHVTGFDDKIRSVFGEARNVLPIMVGLSWKSDAMTLAKRFGFMPLYFSSIGSLIRELTDSEYSIGDEWARIEEKLNRGELSLEELRERIGSLEIKYLFEELIEERLRGKPPARPLETKATKTSRTVEIASEERSGTEVKPMLAVHTDSIEDILSEHPLLSWEYKLNGIRLLAVGKNRSVRLYTRNGRDVTSRYPVIVKSVHKGIQAEDFIIDGELVAVDGDGRPIEVQALLRGRGEHKAEYFLFDVLRVDNRNVREHSYEERRALLKGILKANEAVKIVPRLVSTGKAEIEEFFIKARALGHEGLVAKSTSSPYISGKQHRYWFKYKSEPETLDLVAVGFNYGRGKKPGIGSLLLAVREDGRYLTVGKVGTGFTEANVEKLREMIRECSTETKPATVVSGESPDIWLEPKIVIEVAYEGITKSRKYSSGHSLRFPRFVRVREDKSPEDANRLEKLVSSLNQKIAKKIKDTV